MSEYNSRPLPPKIVQIVPDSASWAWYRVGDKNFFTHQQGITEKNGFVPDGCSSIKSYGFGKPKAAELFFENNNQTQIMKFQTNRRSVKFSFDPSGSLSVKDKTNAVEVKTKKKIVVVPPVDFTFEPIGEPVVTKKGESQASSSATVFRTNKATADAMRIPEESRAYLDIRITSRNDVVYIESPHLKKTIELFGANSRRRDTRKEVDLHRDILNHMPEDLAIDETKLNLATSNFERRLKGIKDDNQRGIPISIS